MLGQATLGKEDIPDPKSQTGPQEEDASPQTIGHRQEEERSIQREHAAAKYYDGDSTNDQSHF